MHWKRWITALVALPLLILLILKGGSTLFTLAVAVVATIALWEYFGIVLSDHTPQVPAYFLLWSYVAGAAIVWTIQGHGFGALIALLVLHLIGAAILSIFRFRRTQDAPVVVLKQVFGVLYIPVSLAFVVLLYSGSDGIHWIFLLLLVVAAGDTGAYYVGSYLGRHKLAPAVSPKKTVEGAIGGLAANLIAGVAYSMLFLPSIPLSGLILFTMVVGAVGQAGDLFESEFKRVAGVKDSGKLLPGHGGFLDRMDALIFAAPSAYLIKEYLLS
ncbi:MAG: phosphatidate cytidylyltransferase [Desulfatitalea sp.]